jgi:uncharacterized protein YbjT (DUF2867 family)
MEVIIFGSSGLVGGHLLQQCIDHPKVKSIVIVVRKPLDITHPKIQTVIADYDSLEQYKASIHGDVFFNCIGTTLKVAGSKEAQYKIDCLYPIRAAKIAHEKGAQIFVSVSSVGTTHGTNFYLNTKADMEKGISEIAGDMAYFLRPSFLVGNRKELRIGERIGIWAFVWINWVLIGSLKKYKSIQAKDVARAMLSVAISRPTPHIMHYDDIMAYSNTMS